MKWIDKIIKKYKYIYINFIDIYFLEKKKKTIWETIIQIFMKIKFINIPCNFSIKYCYRGFQEIQITEINKKNTTTVH